MAIILTSQNNELYVNGQPVGSSGPALFTLTTLEGNPTVYPNSIVSSTDTLSIVSTDESYYTAFITFKLPIIPTQGSIGFVSRNYANTFAFSFDFLDGMAGFSANGSGTQSLGWPVESGDTMTIALTSYTCSFFVNGNLVQSVPTQTEYLNVWARFYASTSYQANNIAFGYLADPLVG